MALVSQKLCNFIAASLSTGNYWIGWGTGLGGTKSDNNLINPANENRQFAFVTYNGIGANPDRIQFDSTISSLVPQSICEAGLFNADGAPATPPSGGDMYIYGDFTGKVLAALDEIVFTIQLTIQ